MPSDAKREALIQALRDAPPVMEKKLRALKCYGARQLARDDFLWHHLLQSMATMGNSRGAKGLIETEANYERVIFATLDLIADEERQGHLQHVLRAAKVRMPAKKSRWLDSSFQRIQAMSGPAAAKDRALAQPGRAEKVAFMKQFEGIGPKYARNI